MTDRIGPFDTADFAQDEWYRSAKLWAPSGVFGTPAASASSGGLAMTTSGLAVTIGTGTGLSRGCLFDRDAAATVPGGTLNGNASLYRMDRIVLRRDLAAKTCAPTWLTGAPSATPTPPALTQVDTGQWDTPLFSFLVPPNNGTTITGIVDERVWIDPDGTPRGLMAVGEQTSTQSSSTSTQARIVGVTNLTLTLYAGRAYRWRWSSLTQTDTVSGVISIVAHGRSGGSAASTDTIVASGGNPFTATGGPGAQTLEFSDLFSVSATGTYTVSAYIARAAGSGVVTVSGRPRAEIVDEGLASALTGTVGLS